MEQINPWIWALGIEDTFIGQTARGERVLDEYDLTQHTQNWREDLELARHIGVQMIRYGIPWYKVQNERGKFDWHWTDQVMSYFEKCKEITPIIDLMHYGTPLWLENEFIHEDYPTLVASYAAEFAKRYPFVKYYTPLNEPFINAEWCGWSGTWPPYLKGHHGFVTMIRQLCKGIVLTVRALREVNPEAIMVHVDASKKYIPETASEEEETVLWNEIRYVTWELIQGNVKQGTPLYTWLHERGMKEEDFDWLSKNAIDIDIVGLNYYPQFSVNVIKTNQMSSEQIPESVPGSGQDLFDIVQDAFNRYNRPIFITETSYRGTVEQRIKWLDEAIETCKRLKESGVDLFGLTWFPFFGMIEWEYRTNGGNLKDNIAPFGLYNLELKENGELDRVPTPVLDRFLVHLEKNRAIE